MLEIQIKCLTKNKNLNKAWWKTNSNKLALIALETQTYSKLIKKFSFSLTIVNNSRIQQLNKKYRNVNRATDVLSFPFTISLQMPCPELELGDIVISIDKVKEQAIEYNHSIEREAAFLFTHGFLHLLGYDHQTKAEEEKMFTLQDKILITAGFPRL